jgi:transposase
MVTTMRSYRIRACPNGAQHRLLDRWFGASQWLWNTALEIRSEAYRVCGLKLTGDDLSRWLTQWKRTPGHAAGNYHISFCAEVRTSWLRITHRVVGVDLGLTYLATLSTGEKIPNSKPYYARLKYLRQQQRCLARRQKGSRRREKQRLRVARAHARVRQERQCTLHKLTTRLVREFDVICIEDLNVKAMARGPHARATYDVAFSELRRRHQAARNLLAEGLRQLAGRDDRDLRVDAGDACPEEDILVQVLAEEARSGQPNRACPEQASFS